MFISRQQEIARPGNSPSSKRGCGKDFGIIDRKHLGSLSRGLEGKGDCVRALAKAPSVVEQLAGSVEFFVGRVSRDRAIVDLGGVRGGAAGSCGAEEGDSVA